jgi:hypothetical protein
MLINGGVVGTVSRGRRGLWVRVGVLTAVIGLGAATFTTAGGRQPDNVEALPEAPAGSRAPLVTEAKAGCQRADLIHLR